MMLLTTGTVTRGSLDRHKLMREIIKSMKLARAANKKKTPIKILYSLEMSCIE